MGITKGMIGDAKKRYKEEVEKVNTVGDFMGKVGNLNDIPTRAEFDTWAWYYTELSSLRVECSRLGLLCRLNNRESWMYLRAYHAHIYSYLQMVLTPLPYPISEKIRKLWRETAQEIEDALDERSQLGMRNLPIEPDLMRKLDMLYDIALKVAQEIGLGFKTTFSMESGRSIERAIEGA